MFSLVCSTFFYMQQFLLFSFIYLIFIYSIFLIYFIFSHLWMEEGGMVKDGGEGGRDDPELGRKTYYSIW